MKNSILFIVLFSVSAFAKAQCSMCRAVIESGENRAIAEGINNGITYLMVFPYLLVGSIIYFIWRTKRESKQEN